MPLWLTLFCSSFFFFNSSFFFFSGKSLFQRRSLTPHDVRVTTISSGTSETTPILNYQVRIAEGYTAPIVVSVQIEHTPFHPTAIAIDHYNSLLYWSDTTERTIRRSKIDGSFIELVAKGTHVGRVSHMALTENGRSLYFTDENTHTLMRINVTNVQGDATTGLYNEMGTNYPREIILQNLKDPRGLALDELYRKIYFVELTGRIYECNLDGSNMEPNTARPAKYRELLVRRPSRVRLNSISVDTTSSTQRRKHALYWTESNSHSLMRSNIDGRRIQQIGGLNGNLVWPTVIQYIQGGDLYFSEYLGTIKKMTPGAAAVKAEPVTEITVDVKGTASDLVNQEVLAYGRVGVEYRLAASD